MNWKTLPRHLQRGKKKINIGKQTTLTSCWQPLGVNRGTTGSSNRPDPWPAQPEQASNYWYPSKSNCPKTNPPNNTHKDQKARLASAPSPEFNPRNTKTKHKIEGNKTKIEDWKWKIGRSRSKRDEKRGFGGSKPQNFHLIRKGRTVLWG